MKVKHYQKMPLFISVEGVNGCGKSYIIPYIQEVFERAELPVLCTREIGGNAFCESIRTLNMNEDLQDMTHLLLALTARNEHIHKEILPALHNGISVVCDRFLDSTYVYQHVLNQIPVTTIMELERLIGIAHIIPDYTLLLDAPTQVLQTRLKARDRFYSHDKLPVEKINELRREYMMRASQNKNRFYVFNTDKSGVEFTIKELIRKLINQ